MPTSGFNPLSGDITGSYHFYAPLFSPDVLAKTLPISYRLWKSKRWIIWILSKKTRHFDELNKNKFLRANLAVSGQYQAKSTSKSG